MKRLPKLFYHFGTNQGGGMYHTYTVNGLFDLTNSDSMLNRSFNPTTFYAGFSFEELIEKIREIMIYR